MSKEPGTLGQRHYSFWSGQLYETYYVYVIRAGKKSPVKIGKALNPLTRMKQLQTANAETLRLLLVVPAGNEASALRLEHVLHERFAEHRLRTSEWFYGPGVAQIIDFVTALSVEMVQSHQHGSPYPPSLAGYPGWTDEERRALEPEFTTIDLTPIPDGPTKTREEIERVYNFVPTLDVLIRRESMLPDQQNRRIPQ